MTPRPTRRHRILSVIGAVLAGLAGAAVIAGSGRTLPFPRSWSPDQLVLWAAEVGPVAAGFTGARALAAMLLGWLALTWLLAVAVRVLRLPGAIRATDALTLPSVRRLADLVAGAAIVTISLVPVAHAGAATVDGGQAAPSVVMRDLGPSPDSAGTTTTSTPTPSAPTTTVPTTTTTAPPAASVAVDGSSAASSTGSTDLPTRPPASNGAPTTGGPAMRSTPAGPPTGTWIVVPGDTLWDIADTTTSARLGRPATGGEILSQLERLLAVNADRLAVPGDADLVFPGQEFLIP